MQEESIIQREMFDRANKEDLTFKVPPGLTKETVTAISKHKNEPDWMLKKRLEAFEIFEKLPIPKWGPDISNLDLNKITFFAVPNAKNNSTNWEDVPEDIKKTFDKLGIPEAEKQALAGVGAQYESSVVYHSIKKEWESKGVIFVDMDIAIQQYPELVKKYFMTQCVPINLHKFVALHGAVWSGGTFLYVPEGVKIDLPLQAYFRMNARKMGQFEHTLIIVEKNAEVHYIEGCLTAGNLITTNPDFKKIEDIKSDDLVLSHDGTYRKVNAALQLPYTGNVYTITLYGDSTQKIQTTEEHPFLCIKREKLNGRNKNWKKEWNLPRYIMPKDYLAIPRNKVVETNDHKEFTIKKWFGKKQGFKQITKKVRINKDFFRLIGYYLAKGSISNNSYLNFSFNAKKTGFIQDLKEIIESLFGIKKFYEAKHKKNNVISLVISSVELCRIFEQFGCSCDTKSIPRWVILESFDKQKELINGFWRGDGNYYKKITTQTRWLKEVIRINTTSEKLARQTREIFTRLGIPAFLNKQDSCKQRRKTMFTIGVTGEYLKDIADVLGIQNSNHLNNKQCESVFFVDGDFVYVPIKNIEKKEVKDIIVYNFSVEGTETYTVGGVVVHNCSAPQYNSNSLHAGCVEIIVKDGAKARYSSVENWSKNTYNLNTKRGIVYKNGYLEWIGGNLGSGCTMLYPCSILVGENARADHIGIAFAGKNQNQDVGAKVYHLAPNTCSIIKSKSISSDGGIATYRGLVKVSPNAINSKSSVQCDALMMDNISTSDTIPYIEVQNDSSDVVHEATVGKIGDEQIFYLMSRGLSEEDAIQMIVAGFIEPVVKELPLEYAVEMNRLIHLEIDCSLG